MWLLQRRQWARIALAWILCGVPQAFATNCLPILHVTFSEDGRFVTAKSNKQLSNVVLKFCDGTTDYKFDGLSSYNQTFAYRGKTLAGVWVKSGCNQSGEGPGYGKRFDRACGATPSPTPQCTPSPTPTGTPSPTPTPTLVQICYHPHDSGTEAEQRRVTAEQLALLDPRDYSLGSCRVDCMGIKAGDASIDACGVCGGDGSRCVDCAGVPNGNAVLDDCGVCKGDGTSCQGCDGIPNSGKTTDACGVCGGDGSSCKDCLGVPNGDTRIDACGVCGGDTSSCLDCLGVPNGSARVDSCGVCGGDGSTCGEDETPLCIGTLDLCGVCNGNNACLDCNGVPNGGAVHDCCGICGGDGNPANCPDLCTVYDTSKMKRQYLRKLKSLYRTLRTYSSREAACVKGAKAAKRRVTLGKTSFQQSKALLDSFISNSVKVCDSIWCTKTNYESVLKTLHSSTKSLYKLSRAAQYGSLRACGATKATDSGKRTSATLKQAVRHLEQIPAQQCSN